MRLDLWGGMQKPRGCKQHERGSALLFRGAGTEWCCGSPRSLPKVLLRESVSIWKLPRPEVVEKTLESPLDCKEIKPVNPRGNHTWFHWKNWCRSWSSNPLATWYEEPAHWKRPWCWERLRAGGERDDRGRDGWMASPTSWSWVCVPTPGDGEGQGSPVCCSLWGHKESGTT